MDGVLGWVLRRLSRFSRRLGSNGCCSGTGASFSAGDESSTSFVTLIALCLVVFSSLAACAGAPERSPLPAEPAAISVETGPSGGESEPLVSTAAADSARFTPQAASLPSIPSGVGTLTSELTGAGLSAASRAALTAAFRDAYEEALFRGMSLAGVLGGDRVHGWPKSDPLAYAQNLRTSEGASNSWGLPSLVLAARPVGGDRVFLVQGDILDVYGRGEGIGGSNGVAGYGAPVSEQFPYEGGRAQRFERGLIAVNQDGARRFLPGERPSTSAAMGDDVGRTVPDWLPPQGYSMAGMVGAFRSAWRAAVDAGLPPMDADSLVRSLSAAVADEPAVGESSPVSAGTVLVQTYGNVSWALVLPLGDGFGLRPLLLAPPFLDFFLSAGSWEAALAAYGVPLSDPFPTDSGMSQRFSAGWMETK